MKRLLFAAALSLAVWQPAHAEEKKPNTLTKEEIAQGWISLFDGETTFGWKVNGTNRIENGDFVLGGEAIVKADFTAVFGICDLQFEADLTHVKDARLILRNSSIKLNYRALTEDKGWIPVSFRVGRGADVAGLIGKVQYAEGQLLAPGDAAPKPARLSSPVVVGFSVPAGQVLKLRNIKLRPKELQPIFNAKDLTGWKEIPGHKSKFSVTDKGELNIKDGNGDIQTEGEYDDFVLQIDCFSNGDHLNSGVFYRCRPGEFWSGYEAQIRNEWISDVKLKDGSTVSGSLTNKGDKVLVQPCKKASANNWVYAREAPARLVNKSDVEEVVDHRDQVVDIGTGGIYNRQPARKVVSNDREWYTMTVVAHGTHMATWVNGYQVADYTDTAPIGDNARKGAKVSKGPISLQGHDPTTDLNFKNIRIAELPKSDDKK